MPNLTRRKFGRRPKRDERDRGFQLRSLAPRRSSRNSRYWGTGPWHGDQLFTPHCVGFSWTRWLHADPVTHSGGIPVVNPAEIYAEAQKVDEWPGEDYDGTSVRAGAKVLQARGFIDSYFWAWDVQTLLYAVLEMGPVVVGTNWYSGMSNPRFNKPWIYARGRNEGGHAYLISGANRGLQKFRVTNSWGRGWGRHGQAWIRFRDMARLIREDGEVCLATEIAT